MYDVLLILVSQLFNIIERFWASVLGFTHDFLSIATFHKVRIDESHNELRA
jgi:hypothetical protein